MLLGNQLRVLFERVGVKRGWAAARKPLNFDGAAEEVEHNFVRTFQELQILLPQTPKL